MSDEAGDKGIFSDPRTEWIKKKIFSTYPKNSAGQKFDKQFEDEINS